jgi:hypothetical protein
MSTGRRGFGFGSCCERGLFVPALKPLGRHCPFTRQNGLPLIDARLDGAFELLSAHSYHQDQPGKREDHGFTVRGVLSLELRKDVLGEFVPLSLYVAKGG